MERNDEAILVHKELGFITIQATGDMYNLNSDRWFFVNGKPAQPCEHCQIKPQPVVKHIRNLVRDAGERELPPEGLSEKGVAGLQKTASSGPIDR